MLEQHAAGERPERDADARGAGPDRDRLLALDRLGNTLVMIERVAGKISAAPTPVIARIAIRAVAESTNADAAHPSAEHDEPEGQDPAAPETVAEAPAGEQQAGEDDV